MTKLEIRWPGRGDQPVLGAECNVLLDGAPVKNVISIDVRWSADLLTTATIRAYATEDDGPFPEGVKYDAEKNEIVIDSYVLGGNGDGVALVGDMALTTRKDILVPVA